MQKRHAIISFILVVIMITCFDVMTIHQIIIHKAYIFGWWVPKDEYTDGCVGHETIHQETSDVEMKEPSGNLNQLN